MMENEILQNSVTTKLIRSLVKELNARILVLYNTQLSSDYYTFS